MKHLIGFLLVLVLTKAYAQYPAVTIPGSEERIITSSIVAGQDAQTTDTLLSNVWHFNKTQSIKLEGKTLALNRFEVHTTALQPGKSPHPPHTHTNEDELVIVKEGQITVTINDKPNIIGPGSIALILPGDAHGIENKGNTKAVYYVLKYTGRSTTSNSRASQAGGSIVLDQKTLKTTNTGKGYRRDYFNRATSQVLQFEMHTTALNAGEMSHPPHTHLQEEVILVIRGNVEMQQGDRKEKGTAGDLFFVSSNVPHNLTNSGKEQCEYFAFQWRN